MSKVIKLPSGNTATFRDPSTMKVKDRKKILLAVGNQNVGIAQGLALIDGVIALLVTEWSFDLILPSIKIESLEELDIPDYDKLAEEAEEARKSLFPSFTKDDGEDSPKDNQTDLNS